MEPPTELWVDRLHPGKKMPCGARRSLRCEREDVHEIGESLTTAQLSGHERSIKALCMRFDGGIQLLPQQRWQ